MIIIIAAMTQSLVIGKNNDLPWSIPEDLKNFKRLTSGHPIIMGRSTYESIGRPLPNRTNIVLSKTMKPQEGIIVCSSLKEAIKTAQAHDETVFIIGGATVYTQALPVADKLCISWVKKDYDGDTYFPEVDWDLFKKTLAKEYTDFVYEEFERQS